MNRLSQKKFTASNIQCDGSFSEELGPGQNEQFDRHQYIAECKRLLSGFRKCQMKPNSPPKYGSKANVEDQKEVQFKITEKAAKEEQKSMGLETLEKMIDEFN